jgi:hypothetical protein
MKTSDKIVLATIGAISLGIVGALLMLRVSLQNSGMGVPEGEMVRKKVALSGFDRMECSGQWNIMVTRGDSFDIEISAPESIIDSITLRVDGATVRFPDPAVPFARVDIAAEIVMPSCTEIRNQGMTRVHLDGFYQDTLTINASGASALTAAGCSTGYLRVHAGGTATVDFSQSAARGSHVLLSGASRAGLMLDGGELSGVVDGASTLSYRGDVSAVSVDCRGAGSLVREE